MNPARYRSALIAAAMLAGTSLAAAGHASGEGPGQAPGPNSSPPSGPNTGPSSGQPQRTGDSFDDRNAIRLKSAME